MSPAAYAILGLLSGALPTGALQYLLERRRDAIRVRAAARLVQAELVSAAPTVQYLNRRGLGRTFVAKICLVLVLSTLIAPVALKAATAAGWRRPTSAELAKMKVSAHAWLCQGHPQCDTTITGVHVAKVPYDDVGVVYATAEVLFGGPSGQGVGVLLYRQATVQATSMHGALKGSPWWWIATPAPQGAPPLSGIARITSVVCRYIQQVLQPIAVIEGCS